MRIRYIIFIGNDSMMTVPGDGVRFRSNVSKCFDKPDTWISKQSFPDHKNYLYRNKMGSFKVRFMMRVRKLKDRAVDIVFSSDRYVKYWNMEQSVQKWGYVSDLGGDNPWPSEDKNISGTSLIKVGSSWRFLIWGKASPNEDSLKGCNLGC